MFPQERAAFFRMATITGLIDRGGFQQTRPLAAVGIMALGAFFRTISARHHRVAGVICLSTFGLMAGETNALRHRIARCMYGVAISAAYSAHIVRAATPVRVRFFIFMASETGAVFIRS